MKRSLAMFLALAAPAALAWPTCGQPGLLPPVALDRSAPRYPPAVREIGVEGSVEVALTVLRDGRVGWVRVLRADPPGYFEQAALAGVRAWRFEPARRGDEAVECRMVTRVRFALVDTVDAPGPSAVHSPTPDPVYPARLLEQRVEGYAEVQFELTADGTVKKAEVITAMPRGEFEAAALAAVQGWHLAPGPDAMRRMTRRFEFRLPDSTLTEVPPILLASAPFPMAACEQRVTGRVGLEVETTASGEIRSARILSSEPAGLFDRPALAIASASRLTPAYRDGRPVAATALLTLFFDPDRAGCPGSSSPDPQRTAPSRPAPTVAGRDERPAGRAHRWTALSGADDQRLPWAPRRQPVAVQPHGSP